MKHIWLPLFTMLIISTIAVSFSPANAQGMTVCKPGASDDALRPLPQALVPLARRLFGLQAMPATEIQQSTVVRCMDGRLLACNYGANLPCGKANTNQSLPAANAWCRQNPNIDFIPAYISGHDRIYDWRCIQGMPTASGPVERVDARGFLTDCWKLIQ